LPDTSSKTDRRLLPVAIIGAGPDWNVSWKPAIVSQSRLKIAGVYDPHALRGEAAARDLDVPHFSGARELFKRVHLKGVLLLDGGWLGAWFLEEAARQRIPVLFAPATMPLDRISAIPETLLSDILIQPDLRRRYTPATMRLRELTATKLGPVDFVSIETTAPAGSVRWTLAELIDWSRFVVQSAVVEAVGEPLDAETRQGTLARLTFRRTNDGRAVTAEIRMAPPSDEVGVIQPPIFSADIGCRTGTAAIRGPRKILWRTTGETGEEELSDDRSSAHVQLDLFARKLVGGLVPAANLDDVRTALSSAGDILKFRADHEHDLSA
jgi:hypothetical protein